MPNFRQSYALIGTGLFLHLGHFGSIYVGMKLGASASIMALFAASQPVLVIIGEKSTSVERMGKLEPWSIGSSFDYWCRYARQ